MPYLRATMTGDIPACKLSAAISRFCSAVQRRRRSRPVITSMRRLRAPVRSVVGASSDSNASAITLSSFLKDDRWHDFNHVAQCAGATSLTIKRLADDFLPKPRVLHPWPEQRFAVKHPRWEPYAGKPLVRICAGGAQ